jgi:DNA gyrase/topoisomerase IV subunit A
MAQEFPSANNFAWLHGIGAFGNKVVGRGADSCGAPRYVSVELSDVAKKVLFVDVDVTERIPNYDESDTEIKTLYPLIPTLIMNPIFGIAVGFATKINPYNPIEIIDNQIAHLKGKKQNAIMAWYRNFKGNIMVDPESGSLVSIGAITLHSSTQVEITELPIGVTREEFVDVLYALEERGKIVRFEDRCTSEFKFTITMPRKGSKHPPEYYQSLFKLKRTLGESLWALDTMGGIHEYKNANEVIAEFTTWRLEKYDRRIQAQIATLKRKLRFELALLAVLEAGITKVVSTLTDSELVVWVKNIVKEDELVDYILAKTIRTLSKTSINTLKASIADDRAELTKLEALLINPAGKVALYISELQGLRAFFVKQYGL